MTKIGRITFLIYFGFAMSVMQVAFGNKEKFPKNIFNGNCLN